MIAAGADKHKIAGKPKWASKSIQEITYNTTLYLVMVRYVMGCANCQDELRFTS